MADEQKIEEQLKAWAQQRQREAGEPHELHPATRKMLQGEVARRFASQRATGGGGWRNLLALWPRFALGGAIFAVLFIGVVVLFETTEPEPAGFELTKVASSPTADPLDRSEVAPLAARDSMPLKKEAGAYRRLGESPAEQSTGLELRSVSPTDSPEWFADKSKESLQSAAPTPLSPQPPTLTYAGEKPVAESIQARKSLTLNGQTTTVAPEFPSVGLPPAQSPAPILAAPPVKAPARSETEELALLKSRDASQAAEPARAAGAQPRSQAVVGQTQNFVLAQDALAQTGVAGQTFERRNEAKRYGLPAARQEAPKVLTAFKVEQRGSDLRIVDGDGSVYNGFVQVAAADADKQRVLELGVEAKRLPAFKDEAKFDELERSVSAAVQSYFFRVTGTNRSLKQPVIFSGYFLPTTNFVPAQPVSPAGAAVGGALAVPTATTALPLSQIAISGKALIGGTNEIPIQAAPTKP